MRRAEEKLENQLKELMNYVPDSPICENCKCFKKHEQDDGITTSCHRNIVWISVKEEGICDYWKNLKGEDKYGNIK